MKSFFNTNLVELYISHLREEGAKNAPSSFDLTLLQNSSTPLLSWIYFNRNKDLSLLDQMLEFDIIRNKQTIGPALLSDHQWEGYRKEKKLYSDAMAIIEKVWPSMYSLIKTTGPIISFIRPNDKFESASDPHCFGEILYAMNSNCPIKWGEILVHEMAHHYLFVITATRNINEYLNRPFKDLRYSNLRGEKRPLIGIYHALLAQACMITFALKILDSNSDKSIKIKAMKIIDKFKIIFPLDLQTITDCNLINFDPAIRNFVLEVKHYFDCYFLEQVAS